MTQRLDIEHKETHVDYWNDSAYVDEMSWQDQAIQAAAAQALGPFDPTETQGQGSNPFDNFRRSAVEKLLQCSRKEIYP